jgi:hypothetical protein
MGDLAQIGRSLCVEPEAELLAAMLDEEQRGPAITTLVAVADGVHQPGDFAPAPVGETDFIRAGHKHPLLPVWHAADDKNQFTGRGLHFHVFT